MKRFIFTLYFCLLCGAMHLSAQTEITIGNIRYSCSGTTATVTGYGTQPTGALILPNTVTNRFDRYTVTSIGSSAFDGCTGLTSIQLPESLTTIGYDAFSYCTRLTSIQLPESLTRIGEGAFSKCGRLTSIQLPESLTSIGSSAFDGCIGLTSIQLPESLTSIGNYAFDGCTGLTSIQLPKSLTSIGECAFYNCSGLTSIQLPESLTSIGSSAFYRCSKLKVVTSYLTTPITLPSSAFDNLSSKILCVPSGINVLNRYKGADVWKNFGTITQGVVVVVGSIFYACSDNKATVSGYVTKPMGALSFPYSVSAEGKTYTVTSIGQGVFDGCSGLASIQLPASLTSIGNNVFNGCTRLTSIQLPESLTSIGSSAFSYCEGLTIIQLPESLTSIGSKAFDRCTGLTSIQLPESLTSIGSKAFDRCTGLTSIQLPESLTSIGDRAFNGCSGLTSIQLPESLTSIGESAFFFCTGLTSIQLPASLTSIGNQVFYGCTGLTSIQLPASLTSIGNNVFNGCTGLTTIQLPASLTSIGNDAFNGCTGLTTIQLPASLTSIGNDAFNGCTGLTTIQLPASLTSIGNDAFNRCTGLTSIQLPESLTSIGSSAFSGCSGLTSIQLPASLTTIGDEAFNGCTGLTSIQLPASLTSIGGWAFYGCSGLTSIQLPASLTSIGGYAFYGCSGLTSIQLPASLTAIGGYAFRECIKLQEINVNAANSVYKSIDGAVYSKDGTTLIVCPSGKTTYSVIQGTTTIGESAFENCRGLTSIQLPESLTSIGSSAFSYCEELTTIQLPESLTSIGDRAFSECSKLKVVTSYLTTPITLPSSAFDNLSRKTLCVPSGADVLSAYKNADVWIGFGTITQEEGVVVDNIIYTCSDNKATVSGYVTKPTGALILPNTVTNGGNTYTVTTIGDEAFYGCSGLTTIQLPASLTSIGYFAFCGCSGLTSIQLPASLTTIQRGAFRGCSGLTSIQLPASLTAIGGYAFWECIKLQEINVNAANSVYKSIDGAVYSKDGTTLIVCPSGKTTYSVIQGTTSIGFSAFDGCSELTSIQLPESLTSIGGSAFENCIKLSEIKVNAANSVYKSIDGVVYSKDGTTLLVCPPGKTTYSVIQGTTSIGSSAFSYCEELTTIQLPESLTSIGDRAFSECSKLKVVTSYLTTPITLPSSAFDNLSRKTLCVPSGADVLSAYKNADVWKEFGTITQGEGVVVDNIIYTCSDNKATVSGYVTKPTGVLSLPNSVSAEGETYTVTSIGNYAFDGCTGLTSIQLPESLTSIGSSAFNRCTGITSIQLPASLTAIGGSAFSECSGLEVVTSYLTTPITLPSSAFDNLSSKILCVPSGANVLSAYEKAGVWREFGTIAQGEGVVVDNIIYACSDNKATVLRYVTNPTGSLVLPNSVSVEGKTYTVTSIGSSAFSYCRGLTSIQLPESLTSIGSYAFRGCSGLTSIQLPESLTTIGDEAFNRCSGLTTIQLPASLTSIGVAAFGYCSGLTTIQLPDSLTSIGEAAFYSCTGLTTIQLPASLTTIQRDAFRGCSGLTSIQLPASLTTIQRGAFRGCSGLTSIQLPKSLTTIEIEAFYGCRDLNIIYLETTGPNINLEEDPFDDCDFNLWLPNASNGFTAFKRWAKATFYEMDYNTDLTLAGTGTEIDPYLVVTPDDFIAMSVRVAMSISAEHFKIANDIDMGETKFTIESNRSFLGTIEGSGNTVKNLKMGSTTNCVSTENCGLFSNVSGTIKNLGLADVRIYTKSNNTGALVGTLSGTIENCYVTGEIIVQSPSVATSTGGVVGTINQGGRAINCYSMVSININESSTTNAQHAGGIVGYNSGKVINSYTRGSQFANTKANTYLGGIAGWNHTEGQIKNCYSTGDLIANLNATSTYESQVGGIAAQNKGSITHCIALCQGSIAAIHSETISNATASRIAYNNGGTMSDNYAIGSMATLMGISENTLTQATILSNPSSNNGKTMSKNDIPVNQLNAFVIANPKVDATDLIGWTVMSDMNDDFPALTWQQIVTYTITTEAENGSVTGGGVYEKGLSIRLSANPSVGYHFVRWGDGVTTATRYITVNADSTYKAFFAINRHTISVSVPMGGGQILGAGEYDYGTEVTLTAVPDEGYEFDSWTDMPNTLASGASVERKVVVNANATYSATFKVISMGMATETNDKVKCYVENQQIVVCSMEEMPIVITDLYGKVICTNRTINPKTRISASVNSIYIVRVGSKVFKVTVK